MSSNIAFLIKCGKIHVKNTEKPTFLILNDYSILRTALPKSHVNLLNFEHLLNQRTKKTLWFLRDTYPKCSDWCEQHTILYANLVLFILKKKNSKIAFVNCLLIGSYSQLFWPRLFEDRLMLYTFTSWARHCHVMSTCCWSAFCQVSC